MARVSATQVLEHFSKYRPRSLWGKDELYFREVLLYEEGQPFSKRESLYVCHGSALNDDALISGSCFLCIDQPSQELFERCENERVIILETSGLTLVSACNFAQELFDANFQKC